MMLLENFWDLLVQSAPWLLLGYLIAGIIHVWLPKSWLQSQLGERSFSHSVKAAIIGAPLPLCSCGVIPTALGLRKSGASKNATASFMVATPETGVDSVSVTYALLGPVMAIYRPIAAILSAIIAGELVRLTDKKDAPAQPTEIQHCCHSDAQSHSHGPSESNTRQGNKSDVATLLSFSFGKLLADTANWLMIGIFFAALVQTYVPESFLTQWGSGLIAMIVMVVISVPMYICATASTPVAAGLMLIGVSPGSVLVFMLTGPATNLATLGILGKELGKHALVAYLTGVVVTAIAMGLLLDWGLAASGVSIGVSEHLHAHEDSLFYLISGVLFSGLLVRYYLMTLWRKVTKSNATAIGQA